MKVLQEGSRELTNDTRLVLGFVLLAIGATLFGYLLVSHPAIAFLNWAIAAIGSYLLASVETAK